jgi:hypothetical protein
MDDDGAMVQNLVGLTERMRDSRLDGLYELNIFFWYTFTEVKA